jgi:transcriptional regulator with XRE-family HTH domain
MEAFSAWLVKELKTRNWTQKELADHSGVSKTAISDAISGKHTPGFEVYIAIAKALRLPPDMVMRVANLLPPLAERTNKQSTLIHLFNLLPGDMQDQVIRHIHLQVTIAEEKEKSESDLQSQ